jgi:hypothetical protein
MRIGRKRQVARAMNHDLVVDLYIFRRKLPSVPLASLKTGLVHTHACLDQRHTMQPQRELIEHTLE